MQTVKFLPFLRSWFSCVAVGTPLQKLAWQDHFLYEAHQCGGNELLHPPQYCFAQLKILGKLHDTILWSDWFPRAAAVF